MSDICGDNRFEIIAEAKSDLLEYTNINDSPEEMAVLDSFLFRCWQMGWLRKYELNEFEWCTDCKEYDQEKHCCHRWTKVIRQTLEEIKSQQSEQKRIFLGIDVSYPKICTYPEYEGKPYYAIKYLEDGETIVGFGTYKPDMLSEYLRKYFIPSAEPERKWIPVNEALPEDMDSLLATIVRSDGEKRVRSGHYYKGYFMIDNGDIWNETDKGILAWMPLPEPWRGE